MKIKSFMKNLFQREPDEIMSTKASSTAALSVSLGNQQPRFTPRRYDRLAEEGFRKNVIVYRCVRLIAQNAAAVPWIVFRGRGPDRQRLGDHELIRLLEKPNPIQGGAEFFESIYAYYLIAGNSYLEAVGPDNVPPLELWALRPDRMQIIPGECSIPKFYRYSVNGRHMDFSVDAMTGQTRILHAKTFHPLDDWYGMSPLEAAAFSIDQHNDAAKWNASLLQNSGRPSGALVYKPAATDAPDTLTQEQRQNLKNELETHYQGSANAGRPLVLEGGLDWKEMAFNPKDMDWIAGKNISAKEIALAFNVPAQLIGIEGSLTYANFEQARLSLFDEAILPLLDHFRDELNRWLVPFFGEDIEVGYDLDAIEALGPRRDKLWERLNQTTFMTLNEKRASVGLPSVDGGDRMD